MFKSAEAGSSKKAIDIVVANAGISGPDEAFNIEGVWNSCSAFNCRLHR